MMCSVRGLVPSIAGAPANLSCSGPSSAICAEEEAWRRRSGGGGVEEEAWRRIPYTRSVAFG